jgi:hypothetical protein
MDKLTFVSLFLFFYKMKLHRLVFYLTSQAASYSPFAFSDEVYRLPVESSKSLWMRTSLLCFSSLFPNIQQKNAYICMTSSRFIDRHPLV